MKTENIPMSAPDISQDDIDAVVNVMKSGLLSIGPVIEQFESTMRDNIGVKFALGVSSGTSALHLILESMHIGPGDEVIVPSFTFAASVNSILFTGATPIFADIDENTMNVDATDVEKKITSRTKAIMGVDVFGLPADWTALGEIAKTHNLRTIDDSCEALGAKFHGKKVGSLAEASTFAFYANKQITSAEGGMVVTNNEEIFETSKSLRNQGRPKMGSWLQHERMGYNYRLSELHAALGFSQLSRLDQILVKRARVASWYLERLKNNSNVLLPSSIEGLERSWFVFVIRLADGEARHRVMSALNAEGIPTRIYFPPVHKFEFIDSKARLPITESVSEQTLALPFSGVMTARAVERVCDAIEKALI